MTKEIKIMMNMVESICKLTGKEIETCTIQRILKDHDWYYMDAVFTDGEKITIKSDCTIVE